MNDMTQKARLSSLGDTAREVYQFVRMYLSQNAGVPPTVREIAEEISGSTSIAWYHMRRLEAAGLFVAVRRNGHTYYTLPELADYAKGLSK